MTAGDPKASAGAKKLTFQTLSPAALAEAAEVMRLGARKYGAYNWAQQPMKASIYYDAMMRHVMAWWAGEDRDPESGLLHTAHALCCAMILVEQARAGTLIDDRPGSVLTTMEEAEAQLLPHRKEN